MERQEARYIDTNSQTQTRCSTIEMPTIRTYSPQFTQDSRKKDFSHLRIVFFFQVSMFHSLTHLVKRKNVSRTTSPPNRLPPPSWLPLSSRLPPPSHFPPPPRLPSPSRFSPPTGLPSPSQFPPPTRFSPPSLLPPPSEFRLFRFDEMNLY